MTIYTSPEKYGLTQIGEVDYSSGSYEFDLTVVWQSDETGALFYADDSGCSCPSPFESFGRHNITSATRHKIATHLQSRLNEKRSLYPGDLVYGEAATADLIDRVMRLPVPDRA